jgi:microsomal dipeptidase-like Zn-dependent dipeptidase
MARNSRCCSNREIPDTLGLDDRMLEPEAVGAIVEGLGRSGLTDGQIRAILGGNWLRIAMQVWR